MSPRVQLTGLHSRSENLVELTRLYDRGRVSRAEVDHQLETETSELVRLQQKLGFEYISDGALSWQDPLRPLTGSLTGVRTGTRYSRWFDTNTFYQKPIITGEISADGFKLDDFLRAPPLPDDCKWKVSIPGPYTFSELSENNHYQNKADLLLDLAKAEREIVRKLAGKGVFLIQLSEPSLVYRPYREGEPSSSELELALDSIRRVIDGGQDDIQVQTFFGDASPILERLLALPVKAVGFDLYETDYPKLDISTDRDVVLGIVDSRESNVESPKWIAETALTTAKRVRAQNVTLAPNSDLKFLPRATADEKARVLAEAARILEDF